MKVAAVQYAPVFKDQAKNFAAMEKLVQAAASNGAHLVVLPELCLSGYSFLSEAEARPFAEILTDDEGILKKEPGETQFRTRAGMQDWANTLGIAIAWGTMEEDPGTAELYNTQVLVVPGGTWTSYRKVNQWGNDYIWSKAGNGSPPITSYMGKDVGLLICADIRDKGDKIENFYEPGDADIVCFSANWGDGGFPAGKWVSFAKLNQCFLVVSNRYGREENNNFGEGGVCVIEPCGKVHCEGLKWSQPCIVYAEIP